MASKIQIHLIDDVDGTEATETITFALDGVTYEIDLSAANAQLLREGLAPWVTAARKTSSTSGTRRRSRAAASSAPRPADVRVWAKENGVETPARGRVPQAVLDAYTAAH